MSMISAQIDELRNTAEFYDGFKAANLMRDAADTIWQLRDDLQQANAENARLRSELESVGIAAYSYGRGDLKAENAKLRDELEKARDPQRIGGQADPSSFVYAIEQLREFRWQHATNDEDAIPYINNVAAAHERENAKLRELVSDFDKCLTEAARLAYIQGHMTIYDGTLLDSLHPRMRELGIEVE